MKKRKERLARKIARSADAVLTVLEDSETVPEAMEYFISLMRGVFCNGELPAHLKRGPGSAPLVGVYCMMVPEELIYAAGAVPVRLSGGCYEGFCVGEELVPRDTCPVVKASVGCTQLGIPPLYEQCDVVIVPTTCDSKRKMAEELAAFQTVWTVEVPHTKEDERLRRMWYDQVVVLKDDLERLTGKKITRKVLYEAIALLSRAQYGARQLYDLRTAPAPPIFGREAALAMHGFAFDRADAWTKAMTRLNEELSKRQNGGVGVCGRDTPRILLAGSPSVFPNWKLLLLIEEMGGVVVTDESCLGDRYLYDPVGISEPTMREMMAALASRYMMPCICPSFSPNDDRRYRLIEMAKAFAVDGIVYQVLKGCILYDFELNRIEKAMKELDIPVVRIETDYNPEDIEQLRTRIEAFMEVLKGKKRKEI